MGTRIALSLLERELHNHNMHVTLETKIIDHLLNAQKPQIYEIIDHLAPLDTYTTQAIQNLTHTASSIDMNFGSQYAPWFSSKLKTEPLTSFDFDTYKARLLSLPGLPLSLPSQPHVLVAVPLDQEAALALRLLVHGIKAEPSELKGQILETIRDGVRGKLRIMSQGVKIYTDCEVEGKHLEFFFVEAPEDPVRDISGVHLFEQAEKITEASLSRSETREAANLPTIVETSEERTAAAIYVDFDLKSLLANERTFLSWTNVAVGVATAGVYLRSAVFVGTGIGFVWLALVLFLLRRRSISAEKVGVVVRSPWFATLFAAFLFGVVIFRIAS